MNPHCVVGVGRAWAATWATAVPVLVNSWSCFTNAVHHAVTPLIGRYLVPFKDIPATVEMVVRNSSLWRLSNNQVQVGVTGTVTVGPSRRGGRATGSALLLPEWVQRFAGAEP